MKHVYVITASSKPDESQAEHNEVLEEGRYGRGQIRGWINSLIEHVFLRLLAAILEEVQHQRDTLIKEVIIHKFWYSIFFFFFFQPKNTDICLIYPQKHNYVVGTH